VREKREEKKGRKKKNATEAVSQKKNGKIAV